VTSLAVDTGLAGRHVTKNQVKDLTFGALGREYGVPD
jgi:hypothetical protein